MDKTSKEWLEVVKKDSSMLEFVPEEFITFELCEIAVKNRGYALNYVPEELKTEELCLAAVKKDGYYLEYVPDKFKTEKICKAAVFTIFLHDDLDYDEWLAKEERYNFIKENVPEEFYEELSEKYDIELPEKGKGR